MNHTLPSLGITALQNSVILHATNDKHSSSEFIPDLETLCKEVIIIEKYSQIADAYENRRNDIDLILLDMDLCVDSFVNTIQFIRDTCNDKRVIIITVIENKPSSNYNLFRKLLKMQVNDFIIKPILKQTTLSLLSKHIKTKHNQTLLREKSKQLLTYKEILDESCLVSETDLNGNITYVNGLFCTTTGYTKKEITGQTHRIIRHPNFNAEVYKDLWALIKKGNTWVGMFQNLKKNGEYYWVKSFISPIKNEHGKIISYISASNIVTEHIENAINMVNLNKRMGTKIKDTKFDGVKLLNNTKGEYLKIVSELKLKHEEELMKTNLILKNALKNLDDKVLKNKVLNNKISDNEIAIQLFKKKILELENNNSHSDKQLLDDYKYLKIDYATLKRDKEYLVKQNSIYAETIESLKKDNKDYRDIFNSELSKKK